MKQYSIYLILLAYFLIGIFTIFFFNGTGDPGDSVHHYLFARYAPQHPELFFDHWAKPMFVLLASPFAQFGFAGMKFFNLLVSLATLFFTFKTAKLFNYRNSLVTIILIICAPLNYLLTFSGLTEPLFALFLILGLYFTQKKQPIIGASVLSFLPFVRSEGLIILGVFGFYYLLNKNWRAILFLGLGHLVYSIAGFFVYHDLLWIFTKIPYAKLYSTYGEGKLDHFVKQLNFVLGIPIYVLLGVGLLAYFWQLFKRRNLILSAEYILILGSFLAFFVAHSLFWYLGIFNSMGLKRVFIGVLPLTALISLKGFNWLTETLFTQGNIKLILQTVLVLITLIFPFLKNRASINWKEMNLTKDQQLADSLATFLKQNQGIAGKTYFYAHPYLSEALEIDHFDKTQHQYLKPEELNRLKKGDIVIWDNWFSVVEQNLSEEALNNYSNLTKIKTFSSVEKDNTSKLIIYKRN